MSLQITSDLQLDFDGHTLHLRDEGDTLVAEFSSLAALRRFRSTLRLRPGPLPEALRLPGLDGITASATVGGRVVAVLDTTDHVAKVRMRWLGLIATVLGLPHRRV